MDAWDIIQKLDGPRLSIPTALVAACGDLQIAAFLQQAAFLSATCRSTDGWFFLPQSGAPAAAPNDERGSLFQKLGSWQHMLQLGPDAQVAVRRKLRGMGLLEEKLKGIPAKLHYRVDPQKYLLFLCGDAGSKFPVIPETCFPEEPKQASWKTRDYVSNERNKGKEQIRTGLAAEPVDNQDPEPQGTPGDELEAIKDALNLSSGQLGKLAGICKGQNCKLQDAHRSLAPHIKSKGLQGQQAFLYFKKCLLQNPGRDWTWEARRNVELEAQAEQATQADKARQRFIDRLAQAGDEGIAVRNGGRIFQAPPEENPEVFLTYQKPDGTSFLSRIIDFLNAFPEFLED
ncbi:hypothetical protein [Thiomonas arsenitoxydans]|uniref:Uncharacterized protein n=1 Tax=Thiomonas arsenitoxydans (strain DSM 22701 / CIP 110005 / 3As) TaxID=426114 RepID=D6CTV8_THIA3|nr:hypothetical protein [Thiomonas arsenitoxydans]CAZ88727.1 hypothetical protein THI_2072 [Thiomonas arsenitoxydans]